jgi:hypothetical protein
MKTAVAETSIESYRSLGNLGPKQAEVYNLIARTGEACNQLLADHLAIPVNRITGRVYELRDMGLVEEAYRAPWEPTGRTVSWWKAA